MAGNIGTTVVGRAGLRNRGYGGPMFKETRRRNEPDDQRKRPGLPGGRTWGDRKTAARAVTSSSRVIYFERRRSSRR